MIRKKTKGMAVAVVAFVTAALAFAAPAHAAGTGGIGGTLTDDGAPVAYASVQVSGYTYEDDGYSGYTSTDEAGHYRLTGVPAGRYRISFQAPGHPVQYATGKASYDEADPITVTAGAETTVDDSLLPTGTISGHFTDGAGNGVFAWVSAVSNGPTWGYETSADGSYSLTVLPGTYRVQFQTPSSTQYAYGTRDYYAATQFTVAAGQTIVVDDTALATGSLSGHVANADGTPASSIEVNAQGDSGSGYATTDGDGNYRIDGLVPDSYLIQFRLPSGATEWAHGAIRSSQAQTFTVSGGTTTTVDETLPATGTVTGRFTDGGGAGAAYLSVQLSSDAQEQYLSAYTDGDGGYRIDGVFAGSYLVQFSNWETNLRQYAYGKVDPETADRITVTGGQTTTVNDTQLPTGTVRITAKDAITGAAIPSFFARIGDHGGDTTSGEIILSDNVLVGAYKVQAGADGYRYTENAATVTVTAGQQAEVVITLTPQAKITTTVVDARTGTPVSGICVIAEKPQNFDFPDGCYSRSDTAGRITIAVDDPGRYQLFVLPPRGSAYGAQWVGWTGGKGDQALARAVVATSGATTTVPTIKLDKTGTITGKVLTPAGQPASGYVGVVGPDLGAGSDRRYAQIAADGTYTVDWLGPYSWPLFFSPQHLAMQWSGGVGNRLLAQRVTVKASATVTYNTTLRQGTQVTVNLPGLDPDGYARVVIRNAVTGDPIAVGDAYNGAVSVDRFIVGPQYVKVQCFCGNGSTWLGGTDLASATRLFIPASGTTTITFPLG